MIDLRCVTKSFTGHGQGVVTAVKDLNLSVDRGEFVVITGRSGSGKTTTLNLMAGLTRPTAGQVYWEGVDVASMPDKQQAKLRNKTIGCIFQFPSLLPSLTVLENVVLPATFFGCSCQSEAGERAGDLLAMVGLSDKITAFPRQLSAGQQQRVVIARSLMNEPRFLLADEPTSNLDVQTESEIIHLLEEIHNCFGVTVVMVTHGRYCGSAATRTIEFSEGKLIL